ncbi:hypothetical protein D3C84_1101850 [compost metagenome]
MLGRQRRLERTVARAAVAAQHLVATLELYALEDIPQFRQVVLTVQVQRVVGIVLLACVFQRVTETGQRTVQAQATSPAGQAAQRGGRGDRNVVQAE